MNVTVSYNVGINHVDDVDYVDDVNYDDDVNYVIDDAKIYAMYLLLRKICTPCTFTHTLAYSSTVLYRWDISVK